jgi:hypothetical protein
MNPTVHYSFFCYMIQISIFILSQFHSLNAPRLNQDSSTRSKFGVVFLKLIVSSVLLVYTCKFRPARLAQLTPFLSEWFYTTNTNRDFHS